MKNSKDSGQRFVAYNLDDFIENKVKKIHDFWKMKERNAKQLKIMEFFFYFYKFFSAPLSVVKRYFVVNA